MKSNDLRDQSTEELNKKLGDLLKDQFKYQMQKATGQLSQTHVLAQSRKNIARVKTMLSEKAGNK
jgi:large subunit ribosomal protein L29